MTAIETRVRCLLIGPGNGESDSIPVTSFGEVAAGRGNLENDVDGTSLREHSLRHRFYSVVSNIDGE
eukprot:CAMPEP_0172379154 /NCGR_PEP_ID=MMETSP1060-20121228/69790_1 /TAXON_ID=37318 /ORGANISM="Pseudo-nitzschia pungens, Strain cf. cingulata" /LENGTH=66 /DNA_ID=CAMNT_0013106891 /DNA_START=997 /DNA_END=1197 /DNA_ORIENTATION=-